MLSETNAIAGSNGAAGSGSAPVPKATAYTRYPSGDIRTVTYPSGTVITRTYTLRDQLKNAVWSGGSANYAYLPDGKVDYLDYGNGVRNRLGYDGRGFPNLIDISRYSPAQMITHRDYWRDTRDRITAWKKTEDGRGDRYSYDAEGQLTSAVYEALTPEGTPSSPARTDTFSYDQLGNRQGWNNVASRGQMWILRRNNGLNQYFSWQNNYNEPDPRHWGSAFWYDDNAPVVPWNTSPANGVMMADGYLTASYNALNQPVAVYSPALTSPGPYLYFGFDPLGRCVKRWSANSNGGAGSNPATYFYYDGWNLIQEGVNANSPSRVYVHGGRVDEIVASCIWSGNLWAYHHYDARGHCILLTRTDASVQEKYAYDAFGYPYCYNSAGTLQSVSGRPGSPWGNRFLFTGREWLGEVGLYDFRARLYQPELGRFMQPDPKEFDAGDYNLYRYAHNDPVNHSDPTGLSTVEFGNYKPVLGSLIPEWKTLFTVIFNQNIGGKFNNPTPQNNSKAGLTANGSAAHGKTDPVSSVTDLGSHRLQANLAINVWVNPAAAAKYGFDRIANLEKEHVWGGEGYKMKGLIGPGGFWDQEKANIGGSISVWRWRDGAQTLANRIGADLRDFNRQQHLEMDAGGGSHDLPPF